MLLIKNGYMIDPKSKQEGKRDILIENGKIMQIKEEIETAVLAAETGQADDSLQIIDADGLIIAPGLIDVHVHFRDPGFTYKEDIETGARAAAKGGFTTVVLMANTKPAVDNVDTLRYILEKGKKTGIHVESCATVTVGMQGKELTDMSELKAAGAVGVTDDGIPLLEEALARKAMESAAKTGMPISFHEEDPAYIENNGINRGKASEYFDIGGSDRQAEISMIKRDLEIALETGAVINIQHISTKEGVELVRQAKKKGSNIHAEATPHHFTLTQEAAIEYGTLAKMNPPLREEEDRLAVLKGLQDGTIDLIATDHAPHSEEEKKRKITEAPSGIIGLETSLSLGIAELVNKGYISMMELMEKMSYHPAKLYGLHGGAIEEGAPADLVIFDKRKTWIADSFVSKSSNSPFLGKTMTGQVCYTVCNGKVVYENV
ncbi:MAG: dihydroorotase [Lachnospiraceae bacterium]|nr:dihydroorotase [Lachnospiraceae bacterium]